ncbi:MAG: stage III sporulation protein AE [Lachnospiraceae bacterium]
MLKKRLLWMFFLFLFLLLSPTISINAENQQASAMMEQLDLESLNVELKNLFPEYQLNFGELVKNISNGKIKLNVELIFDMIKKGILGETSESGKIFVSILVIGLLSALFSNFSQIFENHQIADIGFYFLYMLLIVILVKTFETGYRITGSVVNQIVLFMKLLIPTFFIVVGAASGSLTAFSFYQLTLFVILAVEMILLSVLLPLSSSYLFLTVVNGLNEEERLHTLLELIQKGINLILKLLLGFIGGIGLLQTMITPVIDGLKVGVVKKTISLIPGLGNIADSVTEVVLGSALLIKNSIGVALMLLLLFLCLLPLIKIACLTCLLKVSAALMGMVADKRMTACTNRIGDAVYLLLKIALTALSLFLITVAIVTAATGIGKR